MDDYFKKNNIVSSDILITGILVLIFLQDPKIDYWMFLRYFTFLALAFASEVGVVHSHLLLTFIVLHSSLVDVSLIMDIGNIFFSLLGILLCTSSNDLRA